MDKKIKQILKDVYLIDQSLKMHESTLIKIIQELLRSKPENKIDEQFVRELRVKVIERAKLLNNIKPQTNMFNTLFNKKFSYALIAIIVCAIIITNLPQENDKLAINHLDDNAFGSLSFKQEVESPDTQGKGGGGEGVYGAIEPGQTIGMIAPEMINYNFIYTGDDFELNNDQITVYRTLKGDFLSKSLSNVTKNLDLDILNLNKLQNVTINNIEISEDRDFGYYVYISPRQNSLSINANWEKWPREQFDSPAEMLPDEKLLSIADKFLAEYGINMDQYEQGEVVKPAGISGVFSENATIVYPFKIDDQAVYDQGGSKYGMNISVSLRYERVASVYGIITNTFESSKYTKETDKDKLITFAEDGGLFKNYTFPNAVKTLDLELGTPEVSLVRMWLPSENKMDTAEVLVPSLVFPVITEMPEGTYFYRTNVIVPLVGEILDQYNKPIPSPRTFQ